MSDDGRDATPAGSAAATGLDTFFRPRSIAVIGASSNPGKIGGLPVAYLRSLGYAGRIVPINLTAPEIQGLPAFARIGDVPGPVDLAIIAVPAASAQAAVEECAAAGVRGIVMFSAGFAEIGGEGVPAQERLRTAASAAGIRLLGPNSLGYVNFADRVFATFSPVFQGDLSAPGPIGLVSQSGSFGAFAYSLARERSLGLSHFIATGNEADLAFSECVEWLVDDPATQVIVGYIEGIRDGHGLRRALEKCRIAGKPVVIVKVGRSDAGARAAASHTAALAGDDALFDGVFRQHGAYRAATIEECLDVAYAACTAPLPAGRRAGFYTVSGGAGVLMADAAATCGLEVPELSEKTRRRVLEIVPFAGAGNPLDITGQVVNAKGAFRETLGLLADDPSCDLIITFISATGLSPERGPEAADDIVAVRASMPAVPQLLVTLATAPFRKKLEDAGVPIFSDPYRAVRTAGALAFFAEAKSLAVVRADRPRSHGVSAEGQLAEPAALERLQKAGLPVTPFRHCRSAEEAGEVAADFGCPVAVKIVSSDLAHKAAVGGVRLNVSGRKAVIRASQEIMAEVAAKAPGAQLDGVLVTPMRKGLLECVVGIQRDPVFGPVVMFGLGGVYVETLEDVVFRAAPFDKTEAKRMVGEIRASRLLTDRHDGFLADVDALADLLSKVSEVAAASPELESADMNPVSVGAEGEGCVVLDALLIGCRIAS
jgi:acyl-CoA synthetase (NDP forming)